MSEELKIMVARLDQKLDGIGEDVGEIKTRLDNFCEKCVHVPKIRERIKTLFMNMYALWGVISVGISSIIYVGWWIFVNYVAKKGG